MKNNFECTELPCNIFKKKYIKGLQPFSIKKVPNEENVPNLYIA